MLIYLVIACTHLLCYLVTIIDRQSKCQENDKKVTSLHDDGQMSKRLVSSQIWDINMNYECVCKLSVLIENLLLMSKCKQQYVCIEQKHVSNDFPLKMPTYFIGFKNGARSLGMIFFTEKIKGFFFTTLHNLQFHVIWKLKKVGQQF